MAEHVQPVILAGGAGTRLWPISTEKCPKHLLSLVGSGTLFEQTLERVGDRALFAAPLIVTGAGQVENVAAAAPGLTLVVEPCPRGSAAAVALAAFAVEEGDPILLVMPSDHYVQDAGPLVEGVRRALPVADGGRLITFGIAPGHPETGYGYITAGREIAPEVLEARRFVEKPEREAAERLIASGDSYWNSGMFMFRARAFLDELRRHAPEIHESCRSAMAGALREGAWIRPDAASLDSCPSTSIDYAVMERSDRIAVVPIALDWSDVGSWAAIYDLARKDSSGNAVDEGSWAPGSRGCLVRSTGPSVVAIGVEDLVVIATPDHVLVVPRSEAQRVREAAELANRG